MIWIIGSDGMLGNELCEIFKESNVPFVGTDKEVSILESDALSHFAFEHKPDWIVNCSGYTAVDKAETDRNTAFAINAEGVKNIAFVAKELDVPLVHISTDYVFDGTSRTPLSEDAPVSPPGVYGKSKLAGENGIRKLHNKYFIIRTSWLYGQYGPNFIYTMLKLMNSRDSIKVVNDQHGSPTWTRNLAEFILHLAVSNSQSFGTYHFSGEGECTWYEFANEIYKKGRDLGLIQSQCTINPCASSEFLTPAIRPLYSLLSKEKVKKTFSINIPTWEESLNKYFFSLSGLFNRVFNWIEHSDYDLDTARAMQESGRYLYVAITCQQSLEKLLKAIYEFRGTPIPRIHDLLRLSKIIEIDDKYVQMLKDLSYYYIASRYSERIKVLSADLNETRSSYILGETEEIGKWLKSIIPLSLK